MRGCSGTLDPRRRRGPEQRTNHLLSTLKRMLNLAVKWELQEKNPASSQEKFKEPPAPEAGAVAIPDLATIVFRQP